MRLRGFDEYEITLGDEMRGERASLGKTLGDAERDLRIKASVIRAVEDCDIDGFPNDSVVAGYVRSYARYLGMDAEDCYRRFCAESGFRSPVEALGGSRSGGLTKGVAAVAAAGAGLAQSRFAMPPAPARLGSGVNLGGMTSALALIGLIAGLGYGGHALLQDIQRVGFAPLPEAPEVVAEAPVMGLPQAETALLRRPDAAAYRGDGVLAAISPAELAPPTLPARDGPISAIDPAASGAYTTPARDMIRDRDPALPQLAAAEATPEAAAGPAAPVQALAAPAGPPHVVVHAIDTAWIRVRDGDAAIVFEGTLGPGDRFEVPERTAEPVLRAGNAGAIYLLVDAAAYGPLGGSGRVINGQSLRAGDITSQLPAVSAETLGLPAGEATVQRAEAVLGQ